MKKNLIALLIVALVAVGLFADPANATFQVQTTITGINEMRITATEVDLTDFATADLFSTLTIGGTEDDAGTLDTSSGKVTFSAYISTRSNNRLGYTVKMKATPMTTTAVGSVIPEINYTVAVSGMEGGSYYSADGVDPVEVINVPILEETSVESRAISLTVNMTDYNAAITGNYTGTVTFEYKSI
jgi:hypothetical protein